MNTEQLCMGCMTNKGAALTCPKCGYNENKKRNPFILSHRTILHDQFMIGRVLGKPGGFGITYLGWDIKLETCVAIKEYLPRDLASRDTDRSTVIPYSREDGELFNYGLKQFLQEARTLAKFDHANVMRVRTFFEENDTAYLVMDYYEGISLSEYLRQKSGRISEDLAADIMMPVLDGLREVHAKGFLHRDIKPQNIYLTKDGRPILLDFGAARFAMGERSRSLSVVLTSGFAPYEQYHKKGNQGPWTDIYACGATLYYMVTGKIPAEATERKESDELAPPQKIVRGISKGFSEAVIKALATEPADRFQTIREFQDALERTSKPEPKPEPKPKSEPAPEPAPEPEQKYIHVNCPNCKTKNTVLEGTSLKEAKCKSCGSRLEKKTPPPRPVKGKRSKVPWVIAAGAVVALFVVLFFSGGKERSVLEKEPEYKPFVEASKSRVTKTKKPRQAVQPAKTTASRQGDIWQDPVTDMTFVWVPGGSFMMGSSDSEASHENNEGPVHKVYVDSFWMGKYEVTNEQFTAFLNDKGIRGSKDKPWFETKAEDSHSQVTGSVGNFRVESGYDDYPVVNVSWYGADAFAKWLSKKTGHKFRLPTEAEWEYACRAGTTTPFYFGDTISTDQANYDGNYVKKATRVGSFSANGFGLYDMHGNVWEWCEDWYKKDFYSQSSRNNPECEDSRSGYRVLRGGSWVNNPRNLRCANRDRDTPDFRYNFNGFRLIRLSQDK